MILLDANILFDVWLPDPLWSGWSAAQMRIQSSLHQLAINTIIYAELSPRFSSPSALDQLLNDLAIDVLNIPRAAAFLAGKAYLAYRQNGGRKGNVLPDFFIGAHAAALGSAVLTRDTRRYAAYFPTVGLICPSSRPH